MKTLDRMSWNTTTWVAAVRLEIQDTFVARGCVGDQGWIRYPTDDGSGRIIDDED